MTAFMDRLRLHRVGAYRPDDFLAPKHEMSCDPTGKIERVGLGAREEWRLAVTHSVTFCASKGDFEDALESARRVLVGEMYADVLTGLSALRLAVYNGDRHAALAVVDEIQSSILTPPERPRYPFE